MLSSWRSWARVERGLSDATLKAYEADIARIGPEPETADTARLREILYATAGASSTIARRVAAWRSFFGFLVLIEHRADDPTARLGAPKVKRGLPRPVTDFAARAARLPEPFRSIAVLLIETGLRISEAKGISESVPVGENLRVLGKGGKERIVPLSPAAQTALDQLGGRVHPAVRTIEKRFAAVGMKPHGLRHSYASEIIASGGDIGDVKELLGHASVATSQIYAAFAPERLRQVNERRAAARRAAERADTSPGESPLA